MKKLSIVTVILSVGTACNAAEIWATSYLSNQITRYNDAGNVIGTISHESLSGPLGMTRGANGDVFVANELSNKIDRYRAIDGTWVGTYAAGAGLNGPTSIIFDASGNGYVGNFNDSSVAKYSPSGTFLGYFVNPGTGGLNGPDVGMTFGPDGNLYVPSFYRHKVMKFDKGTGAYLGDFVGFKAGGLTQPRTIIWHNGIALVTSDNGNKVIKYDGVTGAPLGNLVTTGLSGASGMLNLNGQLLVTSWRTDRISKYDVTSGAALGVFSSEQLDGPTFIMAVPEPSTFAMMLGLAAILLKRRPK